MTSNITDRLEGFSQSTAFKSPVDVATTADVTLSGEQTIDDITTAESRILVKDQSTNTENGIYTTSTGAWVRTADFDGERDVRTGTLVLVKAGTANADLIYKVSTAGDPTPGDAMAFSTVGLTGATGATGPQGPQGADGTIDLTTLTNETVIDPSVDELLMRDDSEAANNAVTVQAFWDGINVLTAETAPAVADKMVIYDATGTATDAMTLDNLFKVINGLTADGAPDETADYVVTYDTDAGTAKKVLLQDIADTATIGTTNITDNAVTLAKLAGGTANTLMGFDNSGDPAEITAGTGITIASGVISGGSSGALIDIEEFTASGTWTKPAGTNAIYVEVQAGGGGGGSDSNGNGGGGGTSSFGSHISCTGGSGGTNGSGGHGDGGAGGSATITTGTGLSFNGGAGGIGNSGDQNGATGAWATTGSGGASLYGTPTMGEGDNATGTGNLTDHGGDAGRGYGAGGTGGHTDSESGGGGGGGAAAQVYYDSGNSFSSIGASETITIGAAGSGGTAASNGPGGAGSAGMIRVWSYK